jgi:hypothetical protein
MKKVVFGMSTLLLLMTSCQNKSELYSKTDSFVNSLETTYESYGLIGGMEYRTLTSDGVYAVTPIGRLINVRIEKGVEMEEYEELKEDLKEHYEGDKRVNDVYICGGGTVMIDCRN